MILLGIAFAIIGLVKAKDLNLNYNTSPDAKTSRKIADRLDTGIMTLGIFSITLGFIVICITFDFFIYLKSNNTFLLFFFL